MRNMKRGARRSFTIGAVTALTIVGAVLPTVTANAASLDANATVTTAGSGCPLGTSTIIPDAAAVATGGARALVPAGVQQQDPDAVKSPVLAKIAAMDPTWVQKVDCTITDIKHGPSHWVGAAPTAGRTSAASSGGTSYNWAGWELPYPEKGNKFHDVGMDWTVGPSGGTTESDVAESTWPGIGSGGGSYDTLIQAGADIERGKVASGIVPWYELFPQENEVVINSLPVTSAATEYLVNVEYDSSKNTAYFVVCVGSKCANLSQKLSGTSIAQQAEFIRERNTHPGPLYYPLATSATETFKNTGGSSTDGKYSYGFVPGASTSPTADMWKITMVSCKNRTMVTPGNPNTSGTFSLTVQDSGDREHC